MNVQAISSYQALIQNLVGKELIKFEKFGIKELGFRRFLANGKTIGYSTNQNWNEFLALNPHFSNEMADHYRQEILDVIQNKRQFCLRICDGKNQSLFMQKLYEYGLWNTMAIYIYLVAKNFYV